MICFRKKRVLNITYITILLSLLYLTSLYNYLFFYTIAEFFSICIAFTVFMLSWNSSHYKKNNHLLLLGIAYLFIGLLDLFHTISYKGMAIFMDYDYYANQLWIATRYLESISLLIYFTTMNCKISFNKYFLVGIYTTISILILASVFIFKIFPICFVEGVGLIPFKKISEYIICIILGVAIIYLVRNKKNMDTKMYKWLLWSQIFYNPFRVIIYLLYR